MSITLLPLPYPQKALAPHISADTIKLHYGAHHKGYVDKVNAAVRSGPLANASLNEIVVASHGRDQDLFNAAAQAWNHGFYWHSMSPDETDPSDALKAVIVRDCGSITSLKSMLAKEAEAHFASGWVWLVAHSGKLEIVSTHDAETPITGKANPLLTIDVWEHAYYLDHQNKRADYVKGVTGTRLNWAFASENFARGSAWEYPV